MYSKKNIFLSFSVILIFIFSFTLVKTKSYTVDPAKSQVTWLAKKVTGQHDGSVMIKNGELQVSNGKLSGGMFTIDMSTIKVLDIEDKATNQKLTGHLNSDDFFAVTKYPEATFKITNAMEKKSDAGNYEISGDLSIKGKTENITFPATISMEGNTVNAKATLTFDRSKFDVRYGSNSFFDNLGDKAIYDDVAMSIDLKAAL